MAKVAITIIIFAVALAGLALFGYWQATSSAPATGNVPKIEIIPASYDFGDIDFTQTVNFVFLVKNTGSATLEIKRLATSCGCAIAQMSQREVAPGQSSELFVTYKPFSMGNLPEHYGDQERIIYLKTNDPANPQAEATIRAFVK